MYSGCTRGVLGVYSGCTRGLFLGPISLEVYIRVTSPESPHRVPAHSPKKTDKGRGVSRYVTTRRNPLVCTGRTAGKSPPTDTQGDHEGARGGMRRPRGDHEAIMRGHEVLSPVSFPTFGLLLYYNTHANTRTPTRTPTRTRDHHAYTHANTHTHTHTHTHPHASMRTHGGRRTRRSHQAVAPGENELAT